MKELINMNSRVTVELKDKINKYCEEHGLKIQFLVDKAINEYIDNKEKENK